MIDDIKLEIVAAFNKDKHSVQFIKLYEKQLDIFREKLKVEPKGVVRRMLLNYEWEFKRWFWSFIENAVVHHTHTLTIDKNKGISYDLELVLKSLKGLGVSIKEV